MRLAGHTVSIHPAADQAIVDKVYFEPGNPEFDTKCRKRLIYIEAVFILPLQEA